MSLDMRACLYLFAIALAAPAANADDASQYRTYAQPVELPAPRYPVHELRRNQQSWVILNYVVTDHGRVVEPVNALVESDDPFFAQACIGDNPNCETCESQWQYRPLRRSIEIADVDGQLGVLELRCEWRRFVDRAREGVTWNIPESWGDCSLVVSGETGSTFKLFEIPAST